MGALWKVDYIWQNIMMFKLLSTGFDWYYNIASRKINSVENESKNNILTSPTKGPHVLNDVFYTCSKFPEMHQNENNTSKIGVEVT